MKILRTLIKIIVVLAIVFNVCFILSATSSFLGIKIIKYSGSEMEPALKDGNMVVYKQQENYSKGDIIVTTEAGKLYISRIKEINDYSVITKNDLSEYNNRLQNKNDIIGKIFFVIDKPIIILYYTSMIVILLLLTMEIFLSINEKFL